MHQGPDPNSAFTNELFRSKYRVIKVVGKGSFGEAVLVRSKGNGRRYIAKTIDSTRMSSKEKRDVANEIRILSKLNHTNIIRYQEHFEDGAYIFIIMEYADGGDLHVYIKSKSKQEIITPIDPTLCLFWFLQICMALKYLHDNHILHRDLKTANIFLTSKNIVKLGDFGISTVLQNTMMCAMTVCGTPYYFSPELCQSKPYNNKSDVWALGVVFYETLTLQRPFQAKSLKELLKKILAGQYEPIPHSVPTEIRSLCASLLNVNPQKRPSINRIIETAYIQHYLKKFSTQLKTETDKEAEAAKFRSSNSGKIVISKPADSSPQKDSLPLSTTSALTTATAPQAQPMSDKDQLAMLRGMGRDAVRQMAQKKNHEIQAEIDAQKRSQELQGETNAVPVIIEGVKSGMKAGSTEGDENGHEVSIDIDATPEEEMDMVEQKMNMLKCAQDVVGKPLSGPEEFGDSPDVDTEKIVMATGESVLPHEVRRILEADMGKELLDCAMDIINNTMTSPNNDDAQTAINEHLGAKFAQHSNAVTKLAMWEGKNAV